jgi:hypothetical protein
MTRDEALRRFLSDWKIAPEVENMVSAAFERGWSNGIDSVRTATRPAPRRPAKPNTPLASWAAYARQHRKYFRSLDPRSMVVEMIWSAGPSRREWDEIHAALELCERLVCRGALRTRGRH